LYNGDFMVSESTKYYNANPEKKRKKNATQAKFNKTDVANRVRLNRINRNDPNSKVGDNRDVSHKKGGGYTLEAQAKNRARKGKKP